MHPNYDRRGKWEMKIYYKLVSREIYHTNDIPLVELTKIVGN